MWRSQQLRIVAAVITIVALAPVAMPRAAGALSSRAYGVNLIVNGNAEAEAGVTDDTHTVSLPGWTVHNGLTAVRYNTDGFLTSSSPGPVKRGKNFFAGGPISTLSSARQTIDLVADLSAINHHLVTFTLAGWLGGYQDRDDTPVLTASFKNAAGKTLYMAEIGPVLPLQRHDVSGLLYRVERGRVPAGTHTVDVELQCKGSGGYNDAYADDLSLVLARSSTPPPVFNTNLIVNGDAEAGIGSPDGSTIFPLPGWTVKGKMTALAYALGKTDSDYMSPSSPGPSHRGQNYFAGGPDNPGSSASQAIDISNGSGTVDTGKVGYSLSGWLGGYAGQGDHVRVQATFLDRRGYWLGSVQIGPVTPAERHDITGLLYRQAHGLLPVGTREIDILLQSTREEGSFDDGYADDLALLLTPGSGGATILPTPPATTSPLTTTLPIVAVTAQQVGPRGGALRTRITRRVGHSNTSITEGFALVIPSTALTQTVHLGVGLVPPSAIPTTTQQANNAPIGAAVDLTASTSNGQAVSQFHAPLIVQFTYSQADLGDLNARTLTIAYYDRSSRLWVALPTTIDQSALLLTTRVAHFTLFQVRATAQTPAQLHAALAAEAASSVTAQPVVQVLPLATRVLHLYHFVGSLLPAPGQPLQHLEGVLRLAVDPLTGDFTANGTLTQSNGQVMPVTGTLTTRSLTLGLAMQGSILTASSTVATADRLSGTFAQAGSSSPLGFWVATTAVSTTQTVYAFSGQIAQGPDHGMTQTGTLTLLGDTFGGVIGQVKLADGTQWPVGGQQVNGNLNLLMVVRSGTPEFVVGTAGAGGAFQGDIFGPLAGDRGAWSATPTSGA